MPGVNYRHAFHAGNFADVVKHAALMQSLGAMLREAAPLRVIDTHAGAGVYDLSGEAARKSEEAADGVMRLLDEPEPPDAFRPYLAALAQARRAGRYPGSPVLIARALRAQDRLVACELNPKDHAPLAEVLRPFRRAEARLADGYGAAAEAARAPGRVFVHIDPPYENSADYAAAAHTAARVTRLNPRASVTIWAPLKDLDTFDRFLIRLEGQALAATVAEVRLRPLDDPMRMNGCALALINPPPGLRAPLEAICAWSAQRLGGRDATSRVFEV